MTATAAADDELGLDQRRLHRAAVDQLDQILDQPLAGTPRILSYRG
jgi:hypothetical protein